MHPLPRLLACLGFLLALFSPPLAAVPAADGLYATFTVSQSGAPLGEFTAELHYSLVPRTVANFVGLAEGTQAWIDPVTLRARTDPFYDGILFHRVISGFVIQGGSPQGNGSDGPGYTFPDEFVPTLRHAAAGVLSMAHSGPQSNGSQFFFTLGTTPWLDDVHSVFGTVVEGQDVVDAIGGVATDPNDKPLVDVVIDTVVITRNGAAAEAFDPAAQALPRVEGTDAGLVRDGTSFDLAYTRQADRQYFTATSPELQSWSAFGSTPILRADDPLGPTVTALDSVFDTTIDPRGFVGHAAVAYPDPVLSPPDAVDRRLVLDLGGGTTLSYTVTEPQDAPVTDFGDFRINEDPPENITFYTWRQDAYRVLFIVQATNIVPIRVDLIFTSTGGGTFTAINLAANETFSGTFTFGDAP